jgi:hypothetical protein
LEKIADPLYYALSVCAIFSGGRKLFGKAEVRRLARRTIFSGARGCSENFSFGTASKYMLSEAFYGGNAIPI